MLTNKTVYLRTVEPSDVDHLLKWENATENWRISNTMVPFSRHLIEQYIQTAQDLFTLRQIRFIICLNQTHTPIGTVDLFDYEPIHQRIGVGILIESAHRNQGIGMEVLEIIAAYALNGIGVRNLYCGILADNIASRALFTKAGYREVGCRKNWFNDKGKWIDEYQYQKQLVN